MLQEGYFVQPIDYRDIIICYTDPSTIPSHAEKLIRQTADTALSGTIVEVVSHKGLLESIDIGDVAAENEIQALRRYFVKTPQYQQTCQGHARLVVGRKGAGKSAIFYGVRNDLFHRKDCLILDLKPEGHQFIKLREMVTAQMSGGLQLHTLTAFWNYLLLLELAKKLIARLDTTAWKDPESLTDFQELEAEYRKHAGHEEGDFSERIMSLVNRIVDIAAGMNCQNLQTPEITRLVYGQNIQKLSTILAKHLDNRVEVWLLFDNIDKGWATLGATPADIAIVRCLLEATRKLQHALETRQVDLRSVVFLRKDIYDLLVDQTPDRGKESVANLDWSDPVLLQELVRKRLCSSSSLSGEFEDVWGRVFDVHVAGEDTFRYILSRTFMQPRAVLNFVRKCIQIAISRDHQRVLAEDIRVAEKIFSEDMLNDLRFEIRDVFPDYPDILHEFLGQSKKVSREDILLVIMSQKMPETMLDRVLDTLLWFSFLGVASGDDETYSYQINYDLRKLKAQIATSSASTPIYTIHPAFHVALDVK
jgi:hypothetical protein